MSNSYVIEFIITDFYINESKKRADDKKDSTYF
jgi:hypothetical protein